ncbi:DUF4232 domain-containing protein [Microcella sp.]|uniref:DUF4232 domain-containing protein n=1 Tax=Microcella sp. TaxID=1913979 RepID=UPI003F707933
MSTIRNPVGPLPPEVYWRRRIVVGVVALAVLLIIVLIIVRPGTADPAEQPTPDPQTSETADPGEPGDAPATGDAAACTPSQVTVTPVTDAEVYPAGQQPLLSLTLLNIGTTACTMQAGSDVQSYVITSGSDRIWASTDCQEPGVAAEVTLEPGEPLTSTPFAWSRTRSSADDCTSERDPVIAGGATYRLSVSVGEFESADDRPFILN